MCEFCENRKYLPNIQGKDSYLKVLNILGKFFVQYSGVGAQNETAEINYCPICGRKLSEVE